MAHSPKFTSLRNHAAHNWVVWIQLSNLEQSALFWHQAIGYSVGKIDVFWKTLDKVRGKIVKIIKIFEKMEHITHFGSKMTGHLLCRHSINYHLHLNSLSICNWSNIQKKNKRNHSWLWPVGFKMFQLLKYFDNFDNFTSMYVIVV